MGAEGEHMARGAWARELDKARSQRGALAPVHSGCARGQSRFTSLCFLLSPLGVRRVKGVSM